MSLKETRVLASFSKVLVRAFGLSDVRDFESSKNQLYKFYLLIYKEDYFGKSELKRKSLHLER